MLAGKPIEQGTRLVVASQVREHPSPVIEEGVHLGKPGTVVGQPLEQGSGLAILAQRVAQQTCRPECLGELLGVGVSLITALEVAQYAQRESARSPERVSSC